MPIQTEQANIHALPHSQIAAMVLSEQPTPDETHISNDPFETLYHSLEEQKRQMKGIVVALKQMKNNINQAPDEPVDMKQLSALSGRINDIATSVTQSVKETLR